MTYNLNILDQYVLCLQGTATKLLELTLGQHDFHETVTPLPRVRWAAIHMEAMGSCALSSIL